MVNFKMIEQIFTELSSFTSKMAASGFFHYIDTISITVKKIVHVGEGGETWDILGLPSLKPHNSESCTSISSQSHLCHDLHHQSPTCSISHLRAGCIDSSVISKSVKPLIWGDMGHDGETWDTFGETWDKEY